MHPAVLWYKKDYCNVRRKIFLFSKAGFDLKILFCAYVAERHRTQRENDFEKVTDTFLEGLNRSDRCWEFHLHPK